MSSAGYCFENCREILVVDFEPFEWVIDRHSVVNQRLVDISAGRQCWKARFPNFGFFWQDLNFFLNSFASQKIFEILFITDHCQHQTPYSPLFSF